MQEFEVRADVCVFTGSVGVIENKSVLFKVPSTATTNDQTSCPPAIDPRGMPGCAVFPLGEVGAEPVLLDPLQILGDRKMGREGEVAPWHGGYSSLKPWNVH